MSTEKMSVQDRVARVVLDVVGALPTGAQRILGGKPKEIDGQTLHPPEIQLALRLLSAVEGTSFEHLPVEEGRAQIDAESRLFGGTPIDIETVRDLEIPAGGDHAIPARLYRPAGVSTPAPLLVYFHGGGFVLGSLESGDSVCRFLARHGEVSMLSVDYRLAPEFPFPPAGVDDAVAAFRYCVEHATDLGADPKSIAVGGDSAGGTWLPSSRSPRPKTTSNQYSNCSSSPPGWTFRRSALRTRCSAPTSFSPTPNSTGMQPITCRAALRLSTRESHRCSLRTWPAYRPRTLPSPVSTHYATRVRNTRTGCERPESRLHSGVTVD